MFNLDIDFKSVMPHVIDALTHVYGEEYRSIITNRVNNTVIVYYKDFSHISSYIYHLKCCKKRELFIRFLDEVGYDVSKYKTNNYTKTLDDDLDEILDTLLHKLFCFDDDADKWVYIRAFDSNNKIDPERLLNNRLKVINYLLPKGHVEITKDNIDSFIETDEYKEMLNRVNLMNVSYKKIYDEYHEWEKQLDTLTKYVDGEKERKDKIFKAKKELLFKKIYNKLSPEFKDIIKDKPVDKQVDIVLGYGDIDGFLSLESFKEKVMKSLRSTEGDFEKKRNAIWFQRMYINNLGIEANNFDFSYIENQSDLEKYLSRISEDDIRPYFPSRELVDSFMRLKKRYSNEAEEEYSKARQDIEDNKKLFIRDKSSSDFLYDHITKKSICVISAGGSGPTGDFKSIMFFGKRDPGLLAFELLHEFGHVISQTRSFNVGLENECEYRIDSKKNPYRKDKRLHERLNEAIDDMFTGEANTYLHNKGIYLLEPQEVTYPDDKNNNTSKVVRNLLNPLILAFRKVIIKSLINANPMELIQYVGEDNYEELNDAINKIDYLVTKGLEKKLENHEKSNLVLEYHKQVKRIKEIYTSMYNYYQSNFGNKNNNGIKIKKMIR